MAIRLLPPDVSSKIAAGEVTERPASVVKELLENSLDAGAAEISIEARTGGIEQVRVADNGAGIPEHEVELAFERFATSKLSEASELESISTLGFRGEALPSIAAVSRVTMVTRPASQESGTRIEVEDGRVVTRQGEGAAPGTVVTVGHLFRHFPARRKYLRSVATEASRIQRVTARYVLAYPSVRFRLSMDGSVVLSSSGAGDLREAISAVYGAAVGHELLELGQEGPAQGERLTVPSGMIGPPSLSRATRSHINIFVNGRWVQSRALGYAVEEAYRGFIAERRFPVALIKLGLPHDQVDVNVHPSKTEVRFRREGEVFSSLQQAVRHTLTSYAPVPGIAPVPVSSSAPTVETNALHARPTLPPGPRETQGPAEAEALLPRKALPALRVLGQAQATYITAEGPDGVYLIDQHAAHERVMFEQVKASISSRAPEVQGLMEPVTVELHPNQRELLESQGDLVGRLGFEVSAFGGSAYLLRGVPRLLSGRDPKESFLDVLDLMVEGGGFKSWEERAAYSVACHGAVRAGKTLSQQEMTELTRELESCDQPHTCPHGRPTMIHMSSARLEHEFGRR